MDTKDYSLVRLFPDPQTIDDIVRHMVDLHNDDRYLRFGYSASEENIKKYVTNSITTENTRLKCDFWFGITSLGKLVGTLHVAIQDDMAEFAFTIDSANRHKKLCQLLFARGYQLTCEYRISRIYMVFLSQNSAIRHIAKKFGLSVMTHGTDSEASVNISYPVPLNRVSEVTVAFIDKKLFESNYA
jgi:hypothetical protein